MARRSLPLQPTAIRKILGRSPYADAGDRLRHLSYIKHISDQTQLPVKEVTLLYELVLTRLKFRARVQDFLPVFVARKVTERIKQGKHALPGSGDRHMTVYLRCA